METDEIDITDFAMTEARMIRTALTDAEWEDLLQCRPDLEAALEAYEQLAQDLTAA
ncbi:hypothetical protein ACH4TP_38225 [Streptomyces sp. NPDC021012]|uniref:hypothetical protein n=1 Tax=Streptomyces sp. NPDC021012 TaxID=3365107 RepID=UPI00379D66D8